MQKRVIWQGIIALLVVMAGGFYVYTNKAPAVGPNPPVQPPPVVLPDGIKRGIISPGKNGESVYTNKKYGFSFSFPSEWRVGDDSLGYGTLQFFNFNESEGTGSHRFLSGQNKIEMSIISSDSIYIDENNLSAVPIETIEERKLIVAGQDAFMKRTRFVSGEEIFKSYKVTLRKVPESGIAIVIYGDTENFSVLDKLVKSIEWID